MQLIKDTVIGYCPKQNKEVSILVTFTVTPTLQQDFYTPSKFACEHSRTITHCSDCPIFNKLE